MSNPVEEASELRKDPVLDRWVIIAASRGKRPTDFASAPEPDKSAGCPFCGGKVETIADIIDLAVGAVMRSGGEVEVLHPDQFSQEFEKIGAILRY